MTTTTYIETRSQPGFVTQVRRLSKSGFMYESNSKSPRLDKMIAHINLYDKTTKQIEDELTQEREQSLAHKRMSSARPRPGIGHRACEYHHETEETPAWVTELTARPLQQTIVVTEVEEVEAIDNY